MTKTLTTETIKLWRINAEITLGETDELDPENNAAKAILALTEELLANREAQPVASREHFESLCNQFWNWDEFDEINAEEEPRLQWDGKNYTHCVTAALWRMYQAAPPAPAVPDPDYVQHLKNVRELYHKQEDRLFAIAQRIKGASFDKYSHIPSQAIDALEREIFGDDGGACRAAMLAQPVSQGCNWIACGEQLPAVGETVLVSSDGYVSVGESVRSWGGYRYFTSVATGRELTVTHWMPLPAAPDGGNDA